MSCLLFVLFALIPVVSATIFASDGMQTYRQIADENNAIVKVSTIVLMLHQGRTVCFLCRGHSVALRFLNIRYRRSPQDLDLETLGGVRVRKSLLQLS